MLLELLEAAAHLQVAPLQEVASKACCESLQAANVFLLMSVGDRLTMPHLVQIATQFAAVSFHAVAASDGLLDSSYAQLSSVLQDSDLTVQSEQVIFRAVARWCDAHQPGDAELTALLGHLRFGCMPPSFLNQTVRAWPPMTKSPGIDVLLNSLVSTYNGGTPLEKRGWNSLEMRAEKAKAAMAKAYRIAHYRTKHAALENIYDRCIDLSRDTAVGTEAIVRLGNDKDGILIFGQATITSDSSNTSWGKAVIGVTLQEKGFDYVATLVRPLVWQKRPAMKLMQCLRCEV